jgi:hypothetical protein
MTVNRVFHLKNADFGELMSICVTSGFPHGVDENCAHWGHHAVNSGNLKLALFAASEPGRVQC